MIIKTLIDGRSACQNIFFIFSTYNYFDKFFFIVQACLKNPFVSSCIQ